MSCRSARESWKLVTQVRESRAIRALDYANLKQEKEILQSRKDINIEVIKKLIASLKESDLEIIPEVGHEIATWENMLTSSHQIRFIPHRVQAFIRLKNALKKSGHTESILHLCVIEDEIKNMEKKMLEEANAN